MSTNAKDYYENNPAAMKAAREAVPDLMKAFSGMHLQVMREGALSPKTKELIALGIGVAERCENCIYAHAAAAAKLGATRAQILEAAGVSVMMAGGPAYTYLPRVVEALDALEVPVESNE
jgi:AhpD family alkylhydroperoxidase